MNPLIAAITENAFLFFTNYFGFFLTPIYSAIRARPV